MKPIFNTKPLLQSMLSVTVALMVTACQTAPHPPQHNATPALTTAHDLLSYSLLHRFDQSYDYQKTTKYQVSPLYNPSDIENTDQSVFLTFLTLMSGEHKMAKSRDISPAVADCEQRYHAQYLDWVNNQNRTQPLPVATSSENQTLTSQPLNTSHLKKQHHATSPVSPRPLEPTLAKIQNDYEACLAQVTDTSDKTTTQNTSKLSHLAQIAQTTKSSEFTTIGSIIASQAPDDSYPTTVRKLADYFNELADSQQTDDTAKVLSEEEKINDIHHKEAIGKPPTKVINNNPNDTPTADDQEEDELPSSRSQKLAEMLKNFRVTPEQLRVLNDTMLTPKTLQYQGSFDKTTGQLSSVLTESNDSPYRQNYKRIPMLIDFNEMSLTFEPDALLPMASFLSDKELPKELAGKSVKFILPDNLKQNIPLPLLKDSLITATAKAYSDLDGEKFTEALMDDYGKSLHASRVVKVNLTSQDVGFVIGRTLKYWSQSLRQLQQQHPEYIKNDSNFSATLDLMGAVNRNYRADDVAKLAQFIEAILPISYNSFNYYYFNAQNQLIGYRKVRDYRSSLLQATAKSVTTSQITYRDNNASKPHLYYQPKANDIIDGNALLEKLSHEKQLKTEAQDARFGYLEGENNTETANTALTVADYASRTADLAVDLEQFLADDVTHVNCEKTNKATNCIKTDKQAKALGIKIGTTSDTFADIDYQLMINHYVNEALYQTVRKTAAETFAEKIKKIADKNAGLLTEQKND